MSDCIQCGNPIVKIGRTKGKKYCTTVCRERAYLEKERRLNNGKLDLPSATIGAISEYKVAIDLLTKGRIV
ncbi:hypothetical protein LCGC14_1145790, partial [marine sediment metagenome]